MATFVHTPRKNNTLAKAGKGGVRATYVAVGKAGRRNVPQVAKARKAATKPAGKKAAKTTATTTMKKKASGATKTAIAPIPAKKTVGEKRSEEKKKLAGKRVPAAKAKSAKAKRIKTYANSPDRTVSVSKMYVTRVGERFNNNPITAFATKVYEWQARMGCTVQYAQGSSQNMVRFRCTICDRCIVHTGRKNGKGIVKAIGYHDETMACRTVVPLGIGVALANIPPLITKYAPLLRVVANFKQSKTDNLIQFGNETKTKNLRYFRILLSNHKKEVERMEDATGKMSKRDRKRMKENALNDREKAKLMTFFTYWIPHTFGLEKGFLDKSLLISTLTLIKGGTDSQSDHVDVASLAREVNDLPNPKPGVLVIPLEKFRKILLLDRANIGGRNMETIYNGTALWMDGDYVHSGAVHEDPCVCLHVVVDHINYNRLGDTVSLVDSFTGRDDTYDSMPVLAPYTS